ncbi:MAG: 50S ribosomal protein L1 [Candidatus Aenigmatarchaeota archaeon]
MNEKILKAVKESREKSKKRNFSQTFDLVISLKEFDLKKPESKFTDDVVLPHGRGDEARVMVFSDNITGEGFDVMTNADLQNLAKNKRISKTLVKQTDFFLAEPKLMPVVGKILGAYVGPRGKIPKILAGDANALVKNYKKSVRVRVKDSPVIQCLVGNEKMKDEDVTENIETVLKFLETRLPKGKSNIGKAKLKLTMGEPVKVEM